MDTERIAATLRLFLEETEPIDYRRESSVSDPTSRPVRYRKQIDPDHELRQNEIARPILDRLYRGWRAEHANRSAYEIDSAERAAVKKLLARLETGLEIAQMLGEDEAMLVADRLHEAIWSAAKSAWASGHFSDAVDAAARELNAHLQEVLNRTDVSDQQLVAEAFSSKPPEPGKPRLRYPDIADAKTRASLEQGVLAFGKGCFQAIRNPLAHRPDPEHGLSEQLALERLAALSLLARWIDSATRIEV